MGKRAEKREFTRVQLHATASLDLPDGTTAVGEIVDVSMNGLAVHSAAHVAPGTSGRVALVFGEGPDPVVVRGSGTVVRVGEQGFALKMDELELEGYHHLQQLMLYNGDDTSQVQAELDAHVGLHRR